MSEFRRLLDEALDGRYSVSLHQMGLMEQHYTLLMGWAGRVNLTSIRDPRKVVERHFCESIALGAALPTGALSIVDIGSGAGFPGIPLSVVRPECSVTLVESDAKKAVFLREASAGLSNVRVVRERADRIEDSFDWVVSRAVDWSEIRGVVVLLGRGVGLLTSPALAQSMHTDPAISWLPAVRLPWKGSGVIAMGTLSIAM